MSALAAAIDGFQFLRPAWLLVWLTLPLLWVGWRRRLRRGSPWRRVVDPHLLPALLDTERAPADRHSPLPLLLGVPALAALALAGPAWREAPQPLLRSESGLIVAIDLSDRMRAADLPPDRLNRARFKVADLLRARGDGAIGLIAYAGDAFTVAPLTTDSRTLEALLAALEPDLMPEAGQRADRAIALALRIASDAGLAEADLLLLTDRADDAALAAAERARAQGLRVSVLGVGTAQGAPIPLPGGSFATDRDGRPLLAALQADRLAALASAGGGRYRTISADAGDLRALGLLDPALLDRSHEDRERSVARFHDEGPWLVLLLLPLAALGFRRGWLGAWLPLALLLPAPAAQAVDWSTLWLNAEQRAQRALLAGEADAAAALSRDPARRGGAAYRAGEFDAAIAEYAAVDDADGHYNRGNALARAGRLQEAIDAYDAALALAPEMDDARHNRALVEQALQQPPKDGSQADQSQPSSGEQQPGESPPPSPQDGDAPPDQPGSAGEPPADPEAQDPPPPEPGENAEDGPGEAPPDPPAEPASDPAPGQQDALGRDIDQALQQPTEPPPAAGEPIDPAEAEALQAIEQRLRRIPDDPGGLLRRKFALEHRRRLAEDKGTD